MFPKPIQEKAQKVLKKYREAGHKIVTAESCTGGLVGGALTQIPGSSAVVECGFITYSNAAKQALLGVEPSILKEHGAVSEETAAYMAIGALEFTEAEISIAVTGIAGPDGGSKEKPVGTVWFAVGIVKDDDVDVHTGQYFFEGDRNDIRMGAVDTALALLLEILN